MNKFYSINNINITNSTTQDHQNKNDFGTLNINNRRTIQDNNNNTNDLPHTSRNYLNDYYVQQRGNTVKNQQDSEAPKNCNIPESSHRKQFPIRKLDFKDNSNIKHNCDINNKNNNYFKKRYDEMSFSNIKSQSCKSKIE